MQCAAILSGCKNVNFQMDNCDIFLGNFAENIDCGYTLESPQCGSNEYPQFII